MKWSYYPVDCGSDDNINDVKDLLSFRLFPLPFRPPQDFPSKGFTRFLSCRGYLLPKEWEHLLPDSAEARDLYNVGAMQVYARRISPDALFDPR